MSFADSAYTPSIWPVLGHITDGFGERLDPFSGEGAFHAGVDIASHYGDDVRATADGIVTEVNRRAGYGRLVIIDHGFGVTTWYGHLSAFNIQPGMNVKRGDVIGYEGDSGRSTGAHLHYEVRIYNTPINPWRYFRCDSRFRGLTPGFSPRLNCSLCVRDRVSVSNLLLGCIFHV
jgi:murein DD-endopeptidase MepM/ murein hydrolase activator NlpD